MKFVYVFFGLSFFSLASNAFAIVSGQIYGGGKSTFYEYVDKNNKETMKQVGGVEYGASVHVDPVPLVPFSLGLFARKSTLDIKAVVEDSVGDFSSEESPFSMSYSGSVDGMIYGPEVMAWLAFKLWIPYLRVSYILGKYNEKVTAEASSSDITLPISAAVTYKSEYDASGLGIGIGVQYRPFKLVGFTLEYSILTETLKLKKVTANTKSVDAGVVQQDTSEDVDLSMISDAEKEKKNGSAALLFGINIGI